MKYLIRIFKIALWGLWIVIVGIFGLLISVIIVIWDFSFKNIPSLTKEELLEAMVWESAEPEWWKSTGIIEEDAKIIKRDYSYKNPIDLLLNRKTYKTTKNGTEETRNTQ